MKNKLKFFLTIFYLFFFTINAFSEEIKFDDIKFEASEIEYFNERNLIKAFGEVKIFLDDKTKIFRKTLFKTFLSGFPAGTVSGAPKIRAMEIIDELEKSKRKLYAGGIGYFTGNQDFDTCIALRTALIKDKKIYVQSGAGIVADSNPKNEFNETVNKAKALLKAIN